MVANSLSEQFDTSRRIGEALARPNYAEYQAVSALGGGLQTLGIDTKHILGISGYTDLEQRHGESTVKVDHRGPFFARAFGIAVEGALIRGVVDEEDGDMLVGTVGNIQMMMQGAESVGASIFKVKKLARGVLMHAIEPLEHRSSYTAVDDINFLQAVIDRSEVGNTRTVINELKRLVWAVKTCGADIYEARGKIQTGNRV